MSMEKSAAASYVYARVSGMLSKSYVSHNAVKLFEVRSVSELWALLFKDEVPVLTEKMLAMELEKRARDNFISGFIKLAQNYSTLNPVVKTLIHYYDYENLKNIGASLAFDENKCPELTDISPYNIIDYKKWPRIADITKQNVLCWYDRIPSVHEQKDFCYRLDNQYIAELWESFDHLSSECRSDVLSLFTEKYSIDNILWALRLRIYYLMDREAIASHLAYTDSSRSKDDVIAMQAIKMLDWELDDYDKWSKWRYSSLLNPHEDGVVWNVDPRWIYNSYQKLYVHKAKRLYHQYPFTECPLICYYIIKQNELDNIRTVCESLCLNISQNLAMEKAGVSEVTNG